MWNVQWHAARKPAIAGFAVLMIAGSSLVYAQQRPGGSGGPADPGGPIAPGTPDSGPRPMPRPGAMDAMRGRQFSADDLRAFGEARLAGLKAGLMLNADQEKNWPAFEQAARDFGKLRIDRFTAAREARRAAPQGGDLVDRLQRRADAMVETATALKKLADAAEPLYRSLDDAQKRRFAMLARPLARGFGADRRPAMMRRGGQDMSPGMGPGMGPGMRPEMGPDGRGRGFERFRRDRDDDRRFDRGSDRRFERAPAPDSQRL